jgi:hypothetical protein
MYLSAKQLTTTRRYANSGEGGGEARYDCPLCHEIRGRLYVSFEKGLYYCFNCNASGVLQGQGGQGSDERAAPYVQRTEEQKLATCAPRLYGSAVTYLKNHGIAPHYAYQQGCRSGTGEYEGRIIFTVVDDHGAVVFQSAHAASPDLHPKSISLGTRTPWILHAYKDTDTVLLVEGAADLLRVCAVVETLSSPFPFVGACLWGTDLSEQEAILLAGKFSRAVVLLDRPSQRLGNEERKAHRIVQKLNVFMPATSRWLSWRSLDEDFHDSDRCAKDPAGLSRAGVLQVLQEYLDV